MAEIIPGWNSVEAAARWHRGFEIAGFIALGLLLLFEILSYVYGNRKDTLLRVEQGRSTDQQRQHDQQVEEERERERSDLKGKIDEARKVAAQSAQSTEAAQQRIKALEHWTLTDKQKTDLMDSLSKSPGFKVVVSYNQGTLWLRNTRNSSSRCCMIRNGWPNSTRGSPVLSHRE